ncbi:unnamed protein product [Spirodela intermedia]|uniref:Uncharacterized protein n=1 Tax=Spirodela intermedia TaxID=51605 RepID=A0A7I8LAT4_SPIIN|nr:unnamed protein product [Spirodela intermedia]
MLDFWVRESEGFHLESVGSVSLVTLFCCLARRE